MKDKEEKIEPELSEAVAYLEKMLANVEKKSKKQL